MQDGSNFLCLKMKPFGLRSSYEVIEQQFQDVVLLIVLHTHSVYYVLLFQGVLIVILRIHCMVANSKYNVNINFTLLSF